MGTPGTEIDLHSLFVRYAEGDARAFSRLYDLASPKVWGFVSKRVPNRALAEEVYQEAWAKIHRTRDSFDPKFPALPWIFTVTRSVWLDSLRHQRARPEIPVESDVLEAAAERAADQTVEQATGSGPSGESAPQGWDEIASALSASDRELLDDRYLKEWSFDEISKKLNLSEAGVRQRISRIFRKIRSQKV